MLPIARPRLLILLPSFVKIHGLHLMRFLGRSDGLFDETYYCRDAGVDGLKGSSKLQARSIDHAIGLMMERMSLVLSIFC